MTERVSQFRCWLVDRVSEARVHKVAGQSLEDLARYLGVQPDVLEEATKKRHERIEQAGFRATNREVHGRAGHRVYTRVIPLYVPREVMDPIRALCEQRDILPVGLFRAVIHTFLLSSRNPTWQNKGWLYQGKCYSGSISAPGNSKYQVRISTGAHIALTRRAEVRGATLTGLVRGAILDMLEGRTKKLIYVDTAGMYNDPHRYVLE